MKSSSYWAANESHTSKSANRRASLLVGGGAELRDLALRRVVGEAERADAAPADSDALTR